MCLGRPRGTRLPACVAASRPSTRGPDTGHQAECWRVGAGVHDTIQPLCQVVARKTPVNKSPASSQMLVPKAGLPLPPGADLSAESPSGTAGAPRQPLAFSVQA